MLQLAKRLLGAISTEDRAKLADEALAAVESGDKANVDAIAQRIASVEARNAAHDLAAEARTRRDAEAARLLAERDRSARWAQIRVAVAERAAAAADADKAIDALADAWRRIRGASSDIAVHGANEIDKDASLTRSIAVEFALRGALARPAIFGNFFILPTSGTPPTIEDRIAAANAETLLRQP